MTLKVIAIPGYQILLYHTWTSVETLRDRLPSYDMEKQCLVSFEKSVDGFCVFFFWMLCSNAISVLDSSLSNV
jgi:hypothetical protein